jgi:hypothetical protein
MEKADQDDRNYVLACYASSLIHGETILARAIKTDTIKRYLYAAASFSLARQCVDPRLNFYGKESHHLSKILCAHKHWESMPDRREPVTELMIQYMLKINPGDDTLDAALYDWNVLGKYYGYRRAEWAQDHKNLAKKRLGRLPVSGDVQAFRRDDFIFYGPDGTRIAQGDTVILDENDPNIGRIDCRWRYQKNGDNGQHKSQSRNVKNPDQCPVRAALRIRRRSQTCGAVTSADPMAIFVNPKGLPQYIADTQVNAYLQKVAKAVYKITDPIELARWTCHSIRVGACVTLFNQHKNESFIMFQLRWRSNSWKVYIRDSPHLSEAHIQAFNDGWDAMLKSQKNTEIGAIKTEKT